MHVDLVSESQHESLIDLLCELHTYYNEGATVSRDMVRQHLLENLLGGKSPHLLVVASHDDGRVIGLAFITLVYSVVEFAVDKCCQCQLKELYVRSSERGHGAGRALMSWVAKYAASNGCGRIDWPVKATNTRGISFYESLGAEQVIERLSYRLTEPSLGKLASESTCIEHNPITSG